MNSKDVCLGWCWPSAGRREASKAELQQGLGIIFLADKIMAKDPIYYTLIESSSQPGCPVCLVVLGMVDRYLNAMFYESVNDIPTREQLRKSLGFCSKHAWRLLDGEVGNALGIAIIYHDVLGNVLRQLPDEQGEQEAGGFSRLLGKPARQTSERVKRMLSGLLPRAECPACQEQDQANRLAVSVMLEYLDDERMTAALGASDGLCLPHLRIALQQAMSRDEKSTAAVLALNRDKLAGLHAELAEFIRKNDYRFRDEQFGSESTSWRKAIARIMGERDS